MLLIDKAYTERPFYGSRKITVTLQDAGHVVNRKHVQRLMRLMGLESVAPGPHTSKPHPEHVTYPYLLRGLKIDRPNMVWATDITYIPMASGWGYLVAVMDWFSRAVLAWRLSNTMTTPFCIEALRAALRQTTPDIFNSDQGAQFTDETFVRVLKDRNIRVSMDGRGRCMDNIFVERLWRSLKYEQVYITSPENLQQAAAAIGAWFHFYNKKRPHQSLDNQTPMHVYKTGNIMRPTRGHAHASYTNIQ